MENTSMTMNFVRLTALVIALTTAACSAPLSPAVGSVGDLTVRSGQPSARSLLPNLGTLTYELTMAGPASAVISVSGDTDGIFPLKNLAQGAWTATIDIKSGGSVIATGTAAKTITPISSGILDVLMTYVFGTGTVSPVFSVDASASPHPILAASVLWDGSPLAATYSTTTQTVDLSPGPQPVGTHTLDITFYRDSQKTLPVGSYQTVLVCLAGGSFANVTLGPNNFHAPGAPEMVAVPGGTFTFGTASATVTSFLIGKYPVTQAQFQAVMGFNPSDYNNSNTTSRANPEAVWSPVESVSWFDAAEFTNRLSIAEGLQPVYSLSDVTRVNDHITAASVVTDLTRNGYRLPTEAEYEYATRAGTTTDYFWGGLDGQDYTWGTYNTGSPLTRTYGVGQKLPNPWGLYDMVGNVWSWLNDYSAAQPTVATLDYAGPAGGTDKLFRGGSFLNSSATVPTLDTAFRSDFRGLDDPPETTMSDVGFRVVRRDLSSYLTMVGTIPEATLNGGYGRLLHVAADQQHPGKFLVSGVSGLVNNTGTSPWGTNLMARFNNDTTLDPTFGNNTDLALNAARLPYAPIPMFTPFNQTNVIQTQYDLSFYSGFAQNSWGLYLFQPSIAGGWNHTEVYRHDANGLLSVGYSQPVYTPGTEYFLPFVVYGQFRTFGPPAVDGGGIMYSTGYDAVTGNMAINRMDADGAFPWQNDPANYTDRYYQSPFPIASFLPIRSAFQPDGNLLVVGNDNTVTGVEGKLIRVILGASNGSLDTGFASGGTFAINNGNADGSHRHYSSVQARGNKIYLAGWDLLPGVPSPSLGGFVHILNLDGTLDNTFVLPHPFDRPMDLAVGPTGTLVAVGKTSESPPRAFAYRLTSEGSGQTTYAYLTDPGFGSGALSVAIDSSNNVAVAGYTNKSGWTDERHTVPAFWRF